jgi:hypothetical protein
LTDVSGACTASIIAHDLEKILYYSKTVKNLKRVNHKAAASQQVSTTGHLGEPKVFFNHLPCECFCCIQLFLDQHLADMSTDPESEMQLYR